MKKNFFALATLALMFTACNTNNPEQKELVGTWSEQYYEQTMIKSITFKNDGFLLYTDKPTSEETWPGINAELKYSIANMSKLCFSGERIVFNDLTSKFVREPFAFSTGYSIEGNVLTLDSFSYDGDHSKYYEPLVLYRTEYPSKKEKIPSAQLDEEQINQLNIIFKRENTLLKDFPSCNVIVIHSPEELRCICPINDSIPNLDFSKQCLVFAPIDLSSVNDEIVGCNLYRNTENDIFEYEVEIQKCTECYHVTDHVYAYGIYSIPSEEIKQIDTYVQLLYRY